MKKQHKGNQGIEIIFKDYEYHENGNLCTLGNEHLEYKKKKGEPIKTWVDPVIETEETEAHLIVTNPHYSYEYLKSEIDGFKFYDMEKNEA